MLLYETIYPASMQERRAAAGTRILVILLLKLSIYPVSDG
jgi:hypothetical protein